MEKPVFKTATKEELVEYIEYQDKILNGVSNLHAMLCVSADMIATDVQFIINNQHDKLRILNQDKKYFDQIRDLVKNKADWMALEIKREEEPEPGTEKENKPTQPSKKPNIQNMAK